MNILAVGAHFDDVELGCGGSLLYWKKKGHAITVFVATLSGYNTPSNRVIRSSITAKIEGEKAAKQLGARLIRASFPTFGLEFSEPLNRKLLKAIFEVKPDLVLTHWDRDIHHDHRALSLATQHCCRHVPRLLMYCSNWYESSRRFDPRFFVNITDTIEQKVGLIRMYGSEFRRTRGKWEDFIYAQAKLAGLKAECSHAEAFEVVKWLDA